MGNFTCMPLLLPTLAYKQINSGPQAVCLYIKLTTHTHINAWTPSHTHNYDMTGIMSLGLPLVSVSFWFEPAVKWDITCSHTKKKSPYFQKKEASIKNVDITRTQHIINNVKLVIKFRKMWNKWSQLIFLVILLKNEMKNFLVSYAFTCIS